MYGAGDAGERTVFRQTEKQYRLYKSNPKPRRKNSKSHAPPPETIDLSRVLDFRLAGEGGSLPAGAFVVDFLEGFGRPVFGLHGCPGFYFIPNALSVEEQYFWIRECLMTFPQPPNRTSLTALYGPIYDLYSAAKDDKVLIGVEGHSNTDQGEQNERNCNLGTKRFCFVDCADMENELHKCITARALLRKLRWSTLGLQFAWTERSYDLSLPGTKISEELGLLAKKMALPAMPSGEEFRAEAAIVNYFGPGDMLGGHLDDIEKDWTKPIVSISLGCKAIFLLGGKTRDEVPVAMFLRSGDIVLMAGQARECYHGVPRIFTGDEQSEISELISQLSDEDDLCMKEYIQSSRININIRQVY